MRVSNLKDPRLVQHYREVVAERGAEWAPLVSLTKHLAQHNCADSCAASTSHDILCLSLASDEADGTPSPGCVSVQPHRDDLLEVRYEDPQAGRQEQRLCSVAQLEAAVCARLLRLKVEAQGGPGSHL